MFIVRGWVGALQERNAEADRPTGKKADARLAHWKCRVKWRPSRWAAMAAPTTPCRVKAQASCSHSCLEVG